MDFCGGMGGLWLEGWLCFDFDDAAGDRGVLMGLGEVVVGIF